MKENSITQSKDSLLNILDYMIGQGQIKPSEIARYTKMAFNYTEPEDVRYEMEEWYKNAGIEQVTNKKFSLSACPYSKEELIKIREEGNIVLCVPKDITREEIGKLFHFDTWALADPLVTRVQEEEDFWFYTSSESTPSSMRQTGVEVANMIDDNNYVHFSLERYMIFLARMRFLTGSIPDNEYWIWLTTGRYDRSGMLMAGIDRFGKFNVHGWMPQFYANYLGGRWGKTKV